MSEDLSTTPDQGLAKRLDEGVVLNETVSQLRKDLNTEEIPLPNAGIHAFEELRASVLALIEGWQRSEPAAFSRAINRVDLTERMVDDAMGRGGVHELAGLIVMRCLTKVLSRKRFAGLG